MPDDFLITEFKDSAEIPPEVAERQFEVYRRLMSTRIFDHQRDCPEDVQRRSFPPVVGPGRGRPLKP
jgi:hypothetical protein